jgi:putative methionine-R-sulfoxide reductase with GAF domain
MTRYPIFGSAQPIHPGDSPQEPAAKPGQTAPPENQPANGTPALEPHDLEAALQLLVERAQYITGATGAALALAQGAQMVCRASAGPCAPPVGARLQVQSGLTGESVARKQLLRCDNADTDPRVNLETCRQLGIASIVVLPLLSKTEEVRGLFELFSDHAYAFEERDLIALERMAELTRTALDLAEKTTLIVPARSATQNHREGDASPQGASSVSASPSAPAAPAVSPLAPPADTGSTNARQKPVIENPFVETPLAASPAVPVVPPASSIPVAMQRVQKCVSCGFPVSEGRTLCLDCEQKQHREPGATEAVPAEFVPTFGGTSSATPEPESWLANHVNLLAVLVLILSIVVAIVVFR